jgi:hypothetical protein
MLYARSAGIMRGYRLDSQGSIPNKDKDFSPLHMVQTVSGVHYSMGRRGSFPGGGRAAGT